MNERLGRGLGALIPDRDSIDTSGVGLGSLPIGNIRANRYQPRTNFNDEKLNELAESIKQNGIIQPLIVTKTEGSEYELIAGERRLQAAKLAGLEYVPVVIRSVSKKDQLQLAIIENIQREDLNPIEEALAYQALAEDFALTHQQIAQSMGKDRATITNSIRLLKLPIPVREYINAGLISSGHARAILSVEEGYQTLFADFVITHKLNVRQAEEKAKSFVQNLNREEQTPPPKSALTRSLEQELSQTFGLTARIREHKGRGSITLQYSSPEELENFKNIIKNIR
ncbi:MAG: ParB/RepB/Spo0J family partition protein [Candidatus Cloacimonadaceae bacterium]|nr:ParB/RepB/Spo0J family partition protein [Candidatus Cloacimonadaceae bacterium]